MSLKALLLTALSKEAMTGYEITKGFSSAWGFIWQASHQQVYRELAKLEHSGFVSSTLIEQSSKPNKKRYALTKSGKTELIEWLEKPSKAKKHNDELMIKFFAGEIIRPEILLNEVKNYQHTCQNRLIIFENIEKNVFEGISHSNSFYAQCSYMTLRRGILSLNASLVWCEEVLKNLSKFQT